MEIRLFGKTIAVQRSADVPNGEWPLIEARLRSIDALDETLQGEGISDRREMFHLVDTIVVFRRTRFKNFDMTRSFMDMENGAFYWTAGDLVSAGYSSPERILSYLLHDACHVSQWVEGDRDGALSQLVRREIEATDVQIQFAAAADADADFIQFLVGYRNNPPAIEARLKTGVGWLSALLTNAPRFESHFLIL